MDKTYNPAELEQRWYLHWERGGHFAPAREGAEPYCIMIPPPNVTGTLHMGHGFQQTLMDVLVRYRRMLGHNTLWQAGTDHAGIATQMVVERQLEAEGSSRNELGRETFIERVWQWKATSGNQITRQLRRLGTSLDWETERFTMDEGFSAAVIEAFVRLYRDDLIYRGTRLVNWDTRLQTAVSDLEVVTREEDGHLWHLRYPLADGSGQVIVATTRPETMLGDVAVAVHPDDERYRHLLGKQLTLPLTERRIPIIADTHVDPAFGTGCVKVTPAHDFNDYEIGQRHNLVPINILNLDGTLNEHTPTVYQGLDIAEGRARVLQDLETGQWLERTEQHSAHIPYSDRSNTVIQPMLTEQWFVRTAALATDAVEVVRNGEIRFIPQNWENTYFAWMDDIRDWCISRQLWWGHQIPAWYDPDGNIHVGRSEQEVRTDKNLGDIPLHRDPDVLDTWFSSSLWTFATLGWPEDTDRLRTFAPSSALVTGFDIIFFWVARMIMMTRYFTGQIPFREVYIHGLVRDPQGQKMSKTLGNILDPIDLIDGVQLERLIEKRTTGLMQPNQAPAIARATRKEFPRGIPSYGTDALRFTYCSLAATGRDINFDTSRLEGYRNFCNKLWNASRFVLMHAEGADSITPTESPSLCDRWILSRLQQLIADTHNALTDYRFDVAAQALYEFIWNQYCDWYLEFSKPTLNGDDTSARAATRATLLRVLDQLLRLAHPLIPFITEEIWQRMCEQWRPADAATSLMLSPYPVADEALRDPQAEREVNHLKEIIAGVRTIRGEVNIPPSQQVNLLVSSDDPEVLARIQQHQALIRPLATIKSITQIDVGSEEPIAAVQPLESLRLVIPLAGLVDAHAESLRITRALEKLTRELQGLKQRLQNPDFCKRAPVELVNEQRKRLSAMEQRQQRLHEHQSKLIALTQASN